jgi:hypothetical protein
MRLAELVAALSLATDLGMGQPMEHELRACLLAVRLGEALQRFAEHPRFREIIRTAGLPEPSAVKVSPVHAIGWPAEVSA